MHHILSPFQSPICLHGSTQIYHCCSSKLTIVAYLGAREQMSPYPKETSAVKILLCSTSEPESVLLHCHVGIKLGLGCPTHQSSGWIIKFEKAYNKYLWDGPVHHWRLQSHCLLERHLTAKSHTGLGCWPESVDGCCEMTTGSTPSSPSVAILRMLPQEAIPLLVPPLVLGKAERGGGSLLVWLHALVQQEKNGVPLWLGPRAWSQDTVILLDSAGLRSRQCLNSTVV